MSISQVVMQMWPMWMMGLFMIYLTWKSEHRNILRIEPKPVLKFTKTLAIIAVLRFLAFKFAIPESVADSARATMHMIPWQALFGVFWEDACHSMPLVLAGLMWGGSRWYPWLSKIALAVVALSFGSGHIYQGVFPAVAICAYIPVAMKLGKQFGFGTVMLCHILYDMSTLLTMRWILG